MKGILSDLAANHDLVTAGTAVAALIVSLISIILTVVTIAMQRTHSRKSMMPIGQITVGDYENQISVRLRNDGAGPMIVEKVTVTRSDGHGAATLALIEFMPKLPKAYSWTSFVRDITDRPISPEKDVTLILLEGDPADEKFVRARQSVRKALSELNIKVEYKNIYGEKMSPVIRNLDWFARTLKVQH